MMESSADLLPFILCVVVSAMVAFGQSKSPTRSRSASFAMAIGRHNAHSAVQ